MPSDTISSPPSTITSKTGSDTNNGGNFSPLRWQDFFETKRQVSIPSNVDASNITFNVFEINGDKRDAPVILLNHGAGHCALSFAVTAREIRKLVGDQVRIISYDVRGHGETTSDNQSDLALDRLANDLKNLISTLYEHEAVSPEILLVGHSMGGAIVIETATRNLIPNISGVAALDILEAYRDFAIGSVKHWCETRPDPCESVEQAIQWGVESGTVRNVESARISFTGMVTQRPGSSSYTWYTDLLAAIAVWPTWFDELNKKFLGIHQRKLLILGGHGFLDDEMKQAHEQQKFQLESFTESGHAVEEDEPERMAKELVAFWKNQK